MHNEGRCGGSAAERDKCCDLASPFLKVMMITSKIVVDIGTVIGIPRRARDKIVKKNFKHRLVSVAPLLKVYNPPMIYES